MMDMKCVLAFMLLLVAGANSDGIFTAPEYSDFTILCATPNKAGNHCSWTKQFTTSGPQIELDPTNDRKLQLFDHPENGNCSLSMRSLEVEDTAFYTCQISPDPVFSDTTQLIVTAVPDAPKILYDGSVVLDGGVIYVNASAANANLKCEIIYVWQSPPAQLSWSVEGHQPDANTHLSVLSYDDFRTNMTSYIQLPMGNLPSTQTVTCTAMHIYYPTATRDTRVVIYKI